MPDPTLSEQLRSLIPQDAVNDELADTHDRVASLEHEHLSNTETARIERAFLERAPREGLLYPGDALKLEDVLSGLREAADTEQGLDEAFQQLRSKRPYLFGTSTASPANQKLSEGIPDNPRSALKHGSLTRQVQEIRRRRR